LGWLQYEAGELPAQQPFLRSIRMPERLTVIIPCKDEAHNIRACIESVRDVADEILVADSGSSDSTLDIVQELGGCRIIAREYVNSANFKNWVIPQATHPWVLVVDADERVTAGLADEIRQLLTREPDCDGYRINRDNYFFGHPIRHGICHDDAPLRLFRREYRYQERRVHADVVVPSGKVGRLKARFDHFTVWTVERYMKTLDRYTTWAAQDRFHSGRRASVLGTLFRAPLKFLQAYVIHRGFLDGWAGLQVSILSACYVAIKEAKLWEYEYAGKQPLAEADAGSGLRLFDPQADSSDKLPQHLPLQRSAA
jgi:glycosyltransferase involved in cell wall biosynthesis